MRRFRDSYWRLYRAVVRLNETFDNKTLSSGIGGERVPRSVVSFDILSRIRGAWATYPTTTVRHSAASAICASFTIALVF
jgi:hypothetical protein